MEDDDIRPFFGITGNSALIASATPRNVIPDR